MPENEDLTLIMGEKPIKTGFYYDKPDQLKTGDKVIAFYDEKGYEGVTRHYEGTVAFDADHNEFVLFCPKYAEVHPLKMFSTFQRLNK